VVTAIGLTLHDLAFDAIAGTPLEAGSRDIAQGGGLRAGSYRLDSRGNLLLRRLAFVPGVRLNGRIRTFIRTERQRGHIRVQPGPGVPGGVLTLRARRIRGTLGGRPVAARISPPFAASSGVRSCNRALQVRDCKT
jgi:hypothetical protein